LLLANNGARWPPVLLSNGDAQVPDDGTTVILLGAALVALGIARRFLKN